MFTGCERLTMSSEQTSNEHSGATHCSASVSGTGWYWYDPERKAAWPFDGHHDGDGGLVKLVDSNQVLPVLDLLPRLWETGHVTKEQDGQWWLFDKTGEGVIAGSSFRDLCLNIVLAGI